MKKTKAYKKLAFANFLNLVGIKLFRITRWFCARFINFAIRLDPDRELFKKNLASMGLNLHELLKGIQLQTLSFYTIPEGCKLLSQKIDFIDKHQTISLSLPKVINTDFLVSEEYQCEAKLPDTYLAELNNATVFAGTDLILVNNVALYDEIDQHTAEHYAIKSPMVEKVLTDKLALKTPSSTHKTIDCGIHFVKDHSKNYFHWIIECLPRLSLINQLDKEIPLLVDADNHSQAFEALALLNSDNRPLIKLHRNKSYQVKKLYYPSQLSVVHDNYKLPYYEKDAVYSPKAINFVRNSVLKALNITSQQPNRKLYVSRKSSNYRQLLNANEIENFLAAQGFEIIFPEHLSFFAQVQIFSEAKIIIGQSGAGMANFIFAPKECQVLMMYNGAPQSSLHLFGALATAIDLDLEFFIGKMALPLPGIPIMHTDFYIDLNLLAKFLNDNGWLKE